MADSGTKAAKAGLAYTVGNVLLKGIAFLTLPIPKFKTNQRLIYC